MCSTFFHLQEGVLSTIRHSSNIFFFISNHSELNFGLQKHVVMEIQDKELWSSFCCMPKLVSCCWMSGHMFSEMSVLSTWVTALCALVWFLSSVDAEVTLQSSCMTEWTSARFTEMWPLPTVGEQMLGKIWFSDWGEVAPSAFMWFFSSVNVEVLLQISC